MNSSLLLEKCFFFKLICAVNIHLDYLTDVGSCDITQTFSLLSFRNRQKRAEKFQTSSSVIAQLGFFLYFFFFETGDWSFYFLNLLLKNYLLKVLLDHWMTQVFSLLQYGHSFCACVLKKSLNLWVNAGCKDPCWLLWVFLLDMSKKLNSDGANHLAENQFFTQVCPYYRTVLEASSYNFNFITPPIMVS